MNRGVVSDTEARYCPSLPGMGPHPTLQLRRKGPSVCIPTALGGGPARTEARLLNIVFNTLL